MHRDFVMKTVSIALLLLIAVNGVVSAENLARGEFVLDVFSPFF